MDRVWNAMVAVAKSLGYTVVRAYPAHSDRGDINLTRRIIRISPLCPDGEELVYALAHELAHAGLHAVGGAPANLLHEEACVELIALLFSRELGFDAQAWTLDRLNRIGDAEALQAMTRAAGQSPANAVALLVSRIPPGVLGAEE